MKMIVMEMKDGKKTHNFKSEALNRLIAVSIDPDPQQANSCKY